MSDKLTEKDMNYLRNIDTRPGPNAGRSIDPTKPGPDADRIAELQKGPSEAELNKPRFFATDLQTLSRLRNEQPPTASNEEPKCRICGAMCAADCLGDSQEPTRCRYPAPSPEPQDVRIVGILAKELPTIQIEKAEAIVAALLSAFPAIAQSDAQPVGWQLVPKEPTLEMLRALYSALSSVVLEPTARNFYANMLAKAPTAPHSPDASGLIEAAEWLERRGNELGTPHERSYWAAASALRARAADRSAPRSDKGGA